MRRHAILLAFWLGGCATPAGGSRELTLRTVGDTTALDIASDGSITSAAYQLRATPEGYFGTRGDQTLDLSVQGDRMFGVVGDAVVSMYLSFDGDALDAQGLYAGRMGRLTASRDEITSWIGRCYYVLHATGTRFEGERNCRTGHLQRATVEVPPGFEGLPARRRAMLLALLLSG
jgi:hypothetical protein